MPVDELSLALWLFGVALDFVDHIDGGNEDKEY